MIFDNIQRIASERNITLQKRENECKLGNGTISKWKENNNPKVNNLKAVADYLGTSLETLLA